MKQRQSEMGTVIQTLLWYEAPEILLLQKNKNEFIIAVASPEPISGLIGDCHFVGASLADKSVRDYQEEKFDLRFAMCHASYGRFWAFSFDGTSSQVQLKKYKISSETVQRALPEAGFFARSHDRIEAINEFIPDKDAEFKIDGSWDLGEFSSFYGKMEDIYYISNDMRRFTDGRTSTATKRAISESFKKPWRGGGSYLSYYTDIANDNARTARLMVGGIQYNSPGFVRVRAKRRAFDDMIDMLKAYSQNVQAIKNSYNILHKYLSSHSLLKSSADSFVRPAIEKQILEYSEKLSSYINHISFATLCEMTEQNILVASKVQLSIFRRIEKLYEFFEQGRVHYESLYADPLFSELKENL